MISSLRLLSPKVNLVNLEKFRYADRVIPAWLFSTAAVVGSVVLVGGYTRLSKSGLSMVEWSPQGRRLPKNDEDWIEEFEKYKKFPEYLEMEQKLELKEFKEIYFVEWLHRMLARGSGIFFFIPFLGFSLLGILTRRLVKQLTLVFALGGLQGLAGWWMVRSGLQEIQEHMPVTDNPEPRVSSYRLAIHLTLATLLQSSLIWIGINAWNPKTVANREVLKAAKGSLHLIGLTYLFGAFVAGNRGGLVCNNWPTMEDGRFLPSPVKENFVNLRFSSIFEDTKTTQFVHRTLAYSAFCSTFFVLARASSRRISPISLLLARSLPILATGQLLLGILAVTQAVPLNVGVLHQFGGLSLLTTNLVLLRTLIYFE